MTDANGHETRYAYDPLSRLRTETDALGNTTAYDYTPEGWLKQTTRPDGTTLSYTYDKTGYLLKETASDGTEVKHTFDALGELTEIADETGTTKLRYDERGLLIGVENPLGEHVQYTYNRYGEKVGMTYPDGKQAAYTYDALSRLLSVTEPNGNKTAYTYDALGRRTSTSDGSTTTEYRYDKVGNLTNQTNEQITLTYQYDQNSRMTGETREAGKTVTRTSYAYDKAGQLLSFRRSDGNAETYRYDPAGNMIEKTQNGVKIAMTYTAANELQSMESPHGKLVYAYDANGNLTQKTYNGRTDTYSYDARNHLRQYRGYDNYTVKYSYNALGMLHAKEATGSNSRTTLEELIAGKESSDDPDGDKPRTTTYTYDLTQPYYEVLTESTDGKVTSYTYGLERLAAYTDKAQTKYLYDGRGSVIQTIQVNTENSILGEADRFVKAYSPFGELLTEKVSGYGFNGEYFDAATGMLNLRARQYEPAQGRFSQKDSEKGNVANARSLNAYLYCYNDGVNYFDASGEKPEVVRNSVTVDPGGGGSTKRIATAAQIQAAVNQVGVIDANYSASEAAARLVGQQTRAALDREKAVHTPAPPPAPTITPAATPGPEEVEKMRHKSRYGAATPAENGLKNVSCTTIAEGFASPLWAQVNGALNATQDLKKQLDLWAKGYNASLDLTVLSWSRANIQETKKDHRERGGMIVSKIIDGKEYYKIVKTGVGIEGTCWYVFVWGYLFYNYSYKDSIFGYQSSCIEYNDYSLVGFVHTHTAYRPNNIWKDWNRDDYGPSETDLSLFNLPGISRQYIANERDGVYEFFEDESKRILRDFENEGLYDRYFGKSN